MILCNFTGSIQVVHRHYTRLRCLCTTCQVRVTCLYISRPPTALREVSVQAKLSLKPCLQTQRYDWTILAVTSPPANTLQRAPYRYNLPTSRPIGLSGSPSP